MNIGESIFIKFPQFCKSMATVCKVAEQRIEQSLSKKSPVLGSLYETESEIWAGLAAKILWIIVFLTLGGIHKLCWHILAFFDHLSP